MYILETLWRIFESLMVKIGDLVLFIPLFAAKKITTKTPKKKKVKTLKGETFKLPKAKKQKDYGKLMSNTFRKAIKIATFPVVGVVSMVSNTLKSLSTARKLRLERKKIKKMVEKKRQAKYKNNGYKPSVLYKLKYVFIGFFLALIFLFLPLLSLIFVSDLPNPSSLSVNFIPKTTKIYDRNGNLLYEIFANQNRTIVKLSDVPKPLINATVAIEDKDFYTHPGFDLRGIVRALVVNVSQDGFQGGSTITQQLIKSAFLTPDPTVVRKIKEVALAFWAERVYSKNEIMELYLNYVPYGGTAWGIQSAADIYFGKQVKDLSLAESAFLAGLPQAPSNYSPFFNNGNAWKKRQKEVLNAMVKQNYITRKQADEAYREELVFQNPETPIKAPHFVMYIRNLLVDKYGISEVERGGLNVYTSLDLETQEEAETIVSEEVDASAYLNVGNGAALVTNPSNGDILAMVGSKNYFDQDYDGNVNLTTSLRQPGSSIKLVTYAYALSQGYTEATILDDTPLTINVEGGPSYTPVNYDGVFHGRVPLRTAFANSYNIPPVRIVQKFGADKIKEFGEKLGIKSWNRVTSYGPSITLGGVEVKMTELATAYATVANGGKKIELSPILEIKDSTGKQIFKKNISSTQVLDEGVAFIISDILSDNNARSQAFGPSSALNIPGARVSVKTGTTDSKRDNWTVGYTPQVLVSTWVGNNDNTPLNPNLASGITGAAPMWNKIMSLMLEKTGTPSSALVPTDIVKKFCMGQDRYFVQGTENSVNCRGGQSGTPSVTIPFFR